MTPSGRRWYLPNINRDQCLIYFVTIAFCVFFFLRFYRLSRLRVDFGTWNFSCLSMALLIFPGDVRLSYKEFLELLARRAGHGFVSSASPPGL
jgi:hypothetical protein